MKNNDSCIKTRRVTIMQLSVDNKERLMNILNFEKKHVKEATEIALANYNDERQYVKELPQVCDVPDLNGFAENGLGVAAFENEKMIGFLCCCEPFEIGRAHV